MTTDEINALVCEKVAGLKVYRTQSYGLNGLQDDPPHLGLDIDRHKPLPPYATSADAVLPLLEKHDWDASRYSTMSGRRLCWVKLDEMPQARAETFPLACCLALLRSKGVEVG